MAALQQIGDYEIREEIGRGGFGCVYLAFDPRVQRQVAVKVLNGGADNNLVTRFRTEATAAGNLHHKNIVTVYGYGEDEGRHYLVMEYLEGEDLQALIQNKTALTLLQKVDILSQMADGLLCAHRSRVVHRDVKPANIKVLVDGSVKIMDFGIARLMRGGAARLTQTGLMVGTISYMAPEQFTDVETDELCDIWAYGVISYELLTGHHPFREGDVGAVMYRIASVNPEPVRKLNPECPPALERIVERLLAKDRESRYQNLEDVLFDIAPVLRDLQREHAASLVEQAYQLWRADRKDEANALARKVLDLDPANAQARNLRETIQEDSRKRTIGLRVAALVRQAETEAERRNYPYAIRAAESAMKLSPGDPALVQLRDRLQTAYEQAQRAEQLLGVAKQQLDAGDLDGAHQNIRASLIADRENTDAQRLFQSVRTKLLEQERRNRLREDLSRADVFLGISALEEANGLLARLEREYPDAPEVAEMVARLRAQQELQERRSRMSQQLRAAEKLVSVGQWQEAIASFEELCREYPQEEAARQGLEQAQEKLRAWEREREAERIAAEAARLAAEATRMMEAREFDRALEHAGLGLEQYPHQPMLLEAQQRILAARKTYERGLRIQEALARCGELRSQGRLEEALAALEGLDQEAGQAPETLAERQALGREIAQRNRLQALEDAAAKAQAMLAEGNPGAAAGLARESLAAYGEEPRLRELLSVAETRQREIERAQDISRHLATASGFDSAGDIAGALRAIEEGLARFSDAEELQAAAADLRRRKSVEDYARSLQQSIERRDWTAAQQLVERASTEHPSEDRWPPFALRVRGGLAEADIERDVAAGDLAGARQKLAQAREAGLPLEGSPRLEAAIETAQLRRETLDRAQAMMGAGEYGPAEELLAGLAGRSPGDREALALLGSARAGRERMELQARRQQGRDDAQRLAAEGQYDQAIRSLKALLKQFRGDAEIQGDLENVQQAQENAARQERYQKGCADARELFAKGELDAAIRKINALLKQFPHDAALEQQLFDATAARDAEKRKQEALRKRERVLHQVAEAEFEEAAKGLPELLREFPQDAELRDAARKVAAGRGNRADWLAVYEEMSVIGALHKKGKARQVRDRAQRLLRSIEEPRARQYLQWAEQVLAQQTPRGKLADFLDRNRVAAAIGAAVLVSIVLVLWLVLRR